MNELINERVSTLFAFTDMFDFIKLDNITIGRDDVIIESKDKTPITISKKDVLHLDILESIKLAIFAKASHAVTIGGQNLFTHIDYTINLYNEYLADREKEYYNSFPF